MKSKLRLAIIVPGGVNSGFKGQGFPSMVSLIRGLHKEIDITVYSLAKPNISNELNVKYVPGKGKLKALFLLLLFFFNHIRSPFHIVQAFWGFPSGRLANIISLLFSIPSVITLMGGETASIPELNYGSLRNDEGVKGVQKLIEKSTAIVPVSQYQINVLKTFGFTDFSKFRIISFGIEKRGIEKLYPTKEPFSLVIMANINLVKDHATLIKAFEIISKKINVKLTIVGGDFLNGSVQKIVEEHNLSNSIEFTGILTNKQALQLLENSDLAVLSSKSEGQSVAFSEAMAYGVPFCGTNVGLMNDLSGKYCLAAESGDFEALANNIINVLTDRKLYEKLSMNGLQWTEENNLEVTIDKYLKLYDQLSN